MKRRGWLILCLILAVVPVGCFLAGWVYYVNTAGRRVAVIVARPLHEDVRVRAIIADRAGRTRAMRCYDTLTGEARPPGAENGFVTLVGTTDDGRRMEIVAWEYGERYGVVTQKITFKEKPPGAAYMPFDEDWSVVWFNAADAPMEERSFFTGGGKVTFDLSRGQSQALSKEEADGLRRAP
jgi:hypothetical protein